MLGEANLVQSWIPALDCVEAKLVEPFANDRLEDNLDPLGEAGGFGHFRRATETSFNRVLEARP